MGVLSNYNISLYVEEDEKKDFIKLLQCPIIINDELKCQEYENAIILPTEDDSWPPKGGVRDQNGKWIDNSTAWHYEDKSQFNSYDYIDEDIIYIGSLINIYGHTFTDNISKVWYILDNPSTNYRIVYSASWDDSQIPQYVIDFFLLLGLNINEFIHIKKCTKFRKIIIPDSAFIRHKSKNDFAQIHKKMADLYSTMIANALRLGESISKNDKYKKIYFTRTRPKGSKNRFNKFRDLNESDLEKIFIQNGYTIIRPEQLSVISQINILQQCDEFVATEGSISHNSVFVQDCSQVTILKKGCWVNRYQLALTLLKKNHTAFVDCHHSSPIKKSQNPHAGPFYLECTKLLESYIGRPIPRLNRWFRPSWWFYFFVRSRTSFILLYRSKFIQLFIQYFGKFLM